MKLYLKASVLSRRMTKAAGGRQRIKALVYVSGLLYFYPSLHIATFAVWNLSQYLEKRNFRPPSLKW